MVDSYVLSPSSLTNFNFDLNLYLPFPDPSGHSQCTRTETTDTTPPPRTVTVGTFLAANQPAPTSVKQQVSIISLLTQSQRSPHLAFSTSSSIASGPM